MKKIYILIFIIAIIPAKIFAQTNVGIGTNTPDPSAKLDISSVDKGILIPRVSLIDITNGTAPIMSPANGLMVWNTNPTVVGGYGVGFYYWGGTDWAKVATGNALAATLTNGKIWIGNATNVPTEQTMSSDVTLSNTGVATIEDNSVDGTDIQISANATGDLMYYSGTDWVRLPADTSGFVLSSNGFLTAPSYKSPNLVLVKKNVLLVSGVGLTTTAVTLSDNLGQVVGINDMGIKVKYNNINQDGVLPGPTIANPKQVWGTDASGNPAWRDATNMNRVQNGINLNTTAPGATVAAPYLELGGTLIRNTSISQGGFNYIQDLSGTGVYDLRDSGASVIFVDASGNTIFNNSSGPRIFKLVGDNDANLLTTTNDAVNGDKIAIGNASADNSAKLDITASDKGLLIPRVTLTGTTDATTITTPATSLLVYNTTAAGAGATAVTPGYYYNSGTTGSPSWKRFASGNNSWETSGNYGTVPANNYIGTNDANDFVIRTNTAGVVAAANERMRVTSAGDVVVNEQNNANVFRVEGDNDAALISTKNSVVGTNDYVGIGTVNPDNKLSVNGAGATVATTNTYQVGIMRAGVTDYTLGSDASFVYQQSWSSKPLQINNQGNNVLINPNTGNVGIGLFFPNSKLDIATAVRSGTHGTGLPLYVTGTLGSGAAGSVGVEFRHDNGTQGIGFGFNTMYATGSNINQDLGLASRGTGNLNFTTNALQRMIVLGTNGNVGIGTTGPAELLHVSSSSGNAGIVVDGLAASQSRLAFRSTNIERAVIYRPASSNDLRIYGNAFGNDIVQFGTTSGFVGINTNGAIQTLDVNGRVNVANGVIQRGTTAITATADLGLYQQVSGNWIRIATNAAPIKFFTDQGGANSAGTNATLLVDNANGGAVAIAAETGGTGNATAANSGAALDVQSTTKGMLTPRLTTTQRDAMGTSLAEGLLIYNTTNDCFEFFDTKSAPIGGTGFWNSLCKWCEQVVVVNTNQTGFNLNSYLGGAKSKVYCVYVLSGVTLQASGAGGIGFDASSMPAGAIVNLYNYGNILAGGGNGGAGGQESDAVCAGDNGASGGGAGGHAIYSSSNVPVNTYNYGLIRAGGGGGGGGALGCCSAGGGGGGGAGTPPGAGGSGRCWSCVSGFVCGCGRSGCSGGGGSGGSVTGGVGGGNGNTGSSSACAGTCTSGGGGNGAAGGTPGSAGGSSGAGGGAAGLALQGNGSGSSISNISGTVTGAVNP